jgi:molecular chaperone GrpE
MTDRDPELRDAHVAAGDPASGAGQPAGAAVSDAAGSSDAPGGAPFDPPDNDLVEPLGAPDGQPGGAPPGDPAPETGGPGDPVEPAEFGEAGERDQEDPIVALTQQRDDYRDALIRMQADFENYKKRMMKQQTDHLERAATALVDKLLPVLDTADLALAHGGGEDVKQLTSALTGVLEREGLERIDADGGPFDPTLHDAVAHEPSDDGRQEVVEVMRAGYRWKGRVLRPAMVKVRG